jgi:hypothetical protein
MNKLFARALRLSVVLANALMYSITGNAQQVNIYSYWTGEQIPMTSHYPVFTYLGFLSETNMGFYYTPESQQWQYNFEVGSFPSGNSQEFSQYATVPVGYYLVTFNVETQDYSFEIPEDCFALSASPVATVIPLNAAFCETQTLRCDVSPTSVGWNYQWLRNGTPVAGANEEYYTASPSSNEESVYTCVATCPNNNSTVVSSAFTQPICYSDASSPINYLLVQNVTTTGNVAGQSIQVQFDLNWGNTWKDDVNWDAVWIFMKYKDAQGLWKHCKISPTGYDHGQGTPNIIEPTADQMGAFVRLALEGQGNFNAEGLQLRWNYGADGLSSVSGIEVRVFAIEMVYHPQGEFSVRKDRISYANDYRFYPTYYNLKAPGDKIVVVNDHITPHVTVGSDTLRIKGDAGLDQNADGIIENTTYPTGYYPFYLFKYEISEQQYADFLNCLTTVQRSTLGVAGSSITEIDGQYYASNPNRICMGATPERLLAYADWSGLRPMSFLELHKAMNGPLNPDAVGWYGDFCIDYGNYNDNVCNDFLRASGNYFAGYYGVKNLWYWGTEPFIKLNSSVYSMDGHGNGALSNSGLSNIATWLLDDLDWGHFTGHNYYNYEADENSFRLCRTAE